MKTIIILLLSFFFANVSFTQQYVEKKKQAPKEKNSTVTAVDTCEGEDITVNEENPVEEKRGATFQKKVKTEKVLTGQDKSKLNMEDFYKKMSNYYTVPQIEGHIGYVSFENPTLKGKGFNINIFARQKTNIFDDKEKTKRSTWGGYGKYGRYSVDFSGDNSGRIDIEQYGVGVSFAKTTKRESFNSFTANAGLLFETENGKWGLYQKKQQNIDFNAFGWIDMTRNQNWLFSRTNFSWYWRKSLTARSSALYDGFEAESQTWDKDAVGCEIQQTLLMFYLGDNLGLHFGVSLAYDHYSANMQDWWTGSPWVELYGKGFYKIGQIKFAKKIKGHATTKGDEMDIINISIDGWQLMRQFGIF